METPTIEREANEGKDGVRARSNADTPVCRGHDCTLCKFYKGTAQPNYSKFS